MTTEDTEQQCQCDRHLWVTTGFGFTQRVRCIVCDTNYHPNKEGVSVRVRQQAEEIRRPTRDELLIFGFLSTIANMTSLLYIYLFT